MTNPVSGGFQFTPTQGLNDIVNYPTTPVSETAARQQMMDFYWQLMNEMNKPTLSAAAYAQYNKIFNGGLNLNQRVVSGTVTLAAGAYGHDRWKAGASGCTYTFATSNNDTTITISAGSLIQVIEGNGLVSGTYTLSWNGTAQGKIGGGAYGSSGTSAIIVGGANLNVEFNIGTINKVRFTPGDQILPFNLRNFAEELVLCQRYYEKSYDYATVPAMATAVGATSTVAASTSTLPGFRFSTRKRTSAPTISLYSPSGTAGRVWSGADVDVSAVVTPNNVGDSGCRYLSTTSGLTAGTIHSFHYTCDAEL